MLSTAELILLALAHQPDPLERQPWVNRRETIFTVVLTFLSISWAAVLSRLWVRFRIVREPGLDDVVVFATALVNTLAVVCVLLSVEAGLGTHMIYNSNNDNKLFVKLFYIGHSAYIMAAALIKISLLLQYLRIFKAGNMRLICQVLIVVISVWGTGFSIIAWFPCYPVRGMWDRTVDAKCWAFGFPSVHGLLTAFVSHSTSNVAFDLIVFLIPMVLFRIPKLRLKNALAMGGVLTLGSIVVAFSVWRLHSIVVTQAGTYPYMDFTWWTPITAILFCLEVDLAIVCGSMPIFWPAIEQSISSIFVSFDVDVVEEHVYYGFAQELEHMGCDGRTFSQRAGSMKSGGTSIIELRRDFELGEIDGETNERKTYTAGIDPFDEHVRQQGPVTIIQSKPKPKWEL